MRSPVSISSMALPSPTRRVNRCVPPPPGMIPRLISGCPSLALSEVIRITPDSANLGQPECRLPQLGVVGSDLDVAGESIFHTTTETESVDHRDPRFWKFLNGAEYAQAFHRRPLRHGRLPFEFVDIRPGNECLVA